MIEVVVPKWGLTMEEAEVREWLKQPGDAVAEGEELVELETDKAVGTVDAPVAGKLVDTLAELGDTVTPGQVIARIAPVT